MKRLMALAICAGMIWGCGKKSPTQAGGSGGTESLEVSLFRNVKIDTSGLYYASVIVGIRFNSSNASKVCLLDSAEISCPNDSCPNKRFIKKMTFEVSDTIKAGWSTTTGGWIAESGGYNCVDWGAWPPCHGNYTARAWGRWDGVSHQSAVFEWTW